MQTVLAGKLRGGADALSAVRQDLGGVGLSVSRETSDRLRQLLDLLKRWNRTINLVSRSSLEQAWDRHILDSAQLWRLGKCQTGLWRDLGSGGGFPGLVIAVIAAEAAPDLRVELVEADERKATFLTTASRSLGVAANIRAERIETIAGPPADTVSARALAPLVRLIGLTKRLRHPGGTSLFLKGRTVHKEIAEAQREWSFAYRLHPSQTDPGSAIVEIGWIDGAQ